MRTAAVAVLALLAAGGARAQFAQYTAPGSLAEEQAPTQERLKAAMEEATYHLGPLQFSPWAALKDVGYVSNVYGTETGQTSDFTATLGLGANAYLPLGHRLTLGLYALPEYVWWHKIPTFRGWNGSVGAGLFGYFNRMTIEIKAGGSRQQQYASAEVEVPVNLEDRRASALIEVQVLGKLWLFARGGIDQWRYNDRGLTPDLVAELTPLDRDEKRAGGGVRLHFSKAISLGLGVEQYTTNFVNGGGEQANSGAAPVAELSLKAGRLSVLVNAVALDLKPSGQSGFVPYSGTNGNFQVFLKPAGRLTLEYYGGRNLAYSVESGVAYYLDQRMGLAVSSDLGWRASGKIFWETGHLDYIAQPAGATGRTDDLRDYGALFNVRLGRLVTLVVGGDRTDYTSALLANNYSITRVRTSLQFSSGKAQWW